VETAEDLFASLAVVGAELMVETLTGLAAGTLRGTPQDHALATLAPILEREDGEIDFGRTARRIYDRWRGFQPWPGAWTMLRGKKLIVHRMRVVEETSGSAASSAPGSLWQGDGALLVACGERSVLAFDEVQMEGKRRMGAAEFLRGFQIKTGERLGG
jgi:methionyl-tRNA formyltransferase